ncbi:MAG: hypothetical protein AAFW64_01215 [Pseudomonadota bacterium]
MRKGKDMQWAAFMLVALVAKPLAADPAVVERIAATPQGEAWRFDVTLSHGDTGWDDYADGWRVELADGTILATRTLLHPHVNEQPFTRSQSGVEVPDTVTEVFVRASTNVDGWADQTTPFPIER